MRFFVPFSVCRLSCALSCPRRPASDCPTSTFDRPLFSPHPDARRPSPEVSGFSHSRRCRVNRSRPCGFGSAFRALRVGPCAARAAGTITVHAGPTGSCVAVSLRRDVPLPVLRRTLSQPGRTPALHLSRADRAATLMGFSHPSQCSPSAGPGVCDVTRALFWRASVSAVHPHLPLSKAHRAVYFYSRRSRV